MLSANRLSHQEKNLQTLISIQCSFNHTEGLRLFLATNPQKPELHNGIFRLGRTENIPQDRERDLLSLHCSCLGSFLDSANVNKSRKFFQRKQLNGKCFDCNTLPFIGQHGPQCLWDFVHHVEPDEHASPARGRQL